MLRGTQENASLEGPQARSLRCREGPQARSLVDRRARRRAPHTDQRALRHSPVIYSGGPEGTTPE